MAIADSRLGRIEKAILEQLAPLTPIYNCAIGALDANELKRPAIAIQVFLSYLDSYFENTEFNSTAQIQTIRFEILLRYADMRTHSAAYPLLEAIGDTLSGFKPPEFNVVQPIIVRSQKFLSDLIAEGVWIYQTQIDLQIAICRS